MGLFCWYSGGVADWVRNGDQPTVPQALLARADEVIE
jgi:hypothetical protein